ncbi:MAG: hypothetical protein IJ087_01035 [Eggerthellaceae bacterium]|nr:hypothetical protein [Eggerthellaceae bacterium]
MVVGAAAPNAKKSERIRIRFGNEEDFLELRMIIAYESAIRGRTKSQAIYELVNEAIDIDSYPDEMRECLAEIQRVGAQDIVKRALGENA